MYTQNTFKYAHTDNRIILFREEDVAYEHSFSNVRDCLCTGNKYVAVCFILILIINNLLRPTAGQIYLTLNCFACFFFFFFEPEKRLQSSVIPSAEIFMSSNCQMHASVLCPIIATLSSSQS